MGANSDRAKVATSSIVRLISVPSPKGRDSSAPPCYITSTSMRGYKAWRNFRESPERELRYNGVLRSSALPWCTGVFCAMAHIHCPKTRV